MNITLHVWRQENAAAEGRMVQFEVPGINPDMSFLEMLDVLNERLEQDGKETIAFDHDCREGVCGMCSLVINGVPHGDQPGTTTCQLHMRHFKDGDSIWVEPWRATAFPILRDLMVDRAAFDRIQHAGGYIAVNTGAARDANEQPIAKGLADAAFDAAACIGCGACVAACPNASAMLFVAAKVAQYTYLPQGQPERARRALRMVQQHDAEGFGACSNHRECEAVCPKSISTEVIAILNREYLRSALLTNEGLAEAAERGPG